jgi:endonuclease/exonuclease/phosphatase family metal-dependent hydrolase
MRLKWLFMLAQTLLLTSAAAQDETRVMSFNIRYDAASDGENRWEIRKDRVAGLMRWHGAHFIGAQEVLYNQLAYLSNSLKGYGYIGVGRDDGRIKGEYSCIFYDSSRYERVRDSTFWLSPTPDVISKGWNAAIKRICTYGLFRSKSTGRMLWVFNTHFDHIGDTARLESARLILSRIEALNAGHGWPVVLMGDFNARPEQPPIMLLASRLSNARNVTVDPPYGSADTWNAFRFDAPPDGWIDHIFVSSGIRVRKYATLTDSYDRKYPSDHFPVTADLTW